MTLNIACAFDRNGLEAFAAGNVGADIVVLPELFDGGYKRLTKEGGPSADADALLSQFADISRKRNLTLVAGTIALPGEDGTIRNAAPVYAAGERIATFPKTHLFRPLGDDRYFVPGKPGQTVTLNCRGQEVRIGVIVCYDLRFPEIARPWFKSGLDILFVPARWPRVRDEVWRVLLCARAIENQCFVIGVNSRDDEGGGSYAFDPGGVEVFALGPDPHADEPPYHTFAIDLDEIARVKSRLDTRVDACLL
jgi:predicted amidohydrolase